MFHCVCVFILVSHLQIFNHKYLWTLNCIAVYLVHWYGKRACFHFKNCLMIIRCDNLNFSYASDKMLATSSLQHKLLEICKMLNFTCALKHISVLRICELDHAIWDFLISTIFSTFSLMLLKKGTLGIGYTTVFPVVWFSTIRENYSTLVSLPSQNSKVEGWGLVEYYHVDKTVDLPSINDLICPKNCLPLTCVNNMRSVAQKSLIFWESGFIQQWTFEFHHWTGFSVVCELLQRKRSKTKDWRIEWK